MKEIDEEVQKCVAVRDLWSICAAMKVCHRVHDGATFRYCCTQCVDDIYMCSTQRDHGGNLQEIRVGVSDCTRGDHCDAKVHVFDPAADAQGCMRGLSRDCDSVCHK